MIACRNMSNLNKLRSSAVRPLMKDLRSMTLKKIRVKMEIWKNNNTGTLHFPRLFVDRDFSAATNGHCLQGVNGPRVGTMTATSERLA